LGEVHFKSPLGVEQKSERMGVWVGKKENQNSGESGGDL